MIVFLSFFCYTFVMDKNDLKKVSDYIFEIPKSYRSDMRVPGRIYISEKMLDDVLKDQSLEQVVNVATFPGITKYSLAMPDIHSGYGFPIGGVCATDIESNGIISPGGIGFDINCGVRLLTSGLFFSEIKDDIEKIANQMQRDVPSGLGRGVTQKLSLAEIDNVLKSGTKWAIGKGFGFENDLEFIEENGCLKNADIKNVSELAKKRGLDQVGTLGSGNHFLEVQRVEKIFDEEIAQEFGLFENEITFLIHTGSRGLGHQIASDYVRFMVSVMPKYNIIVPDRELSCAPFNSEEGQQYFNAMAAAANFAWANRQMITHKVRLAVKRILGKKYKELKIVYDVAHNMAKVEEYDGKKYCVQRKGATRAFPPGSLEIPEKYRETGQPVLIPGTMGTASYVLAGLASGKETFYSSCHGAGRRMSRGQAKRSVLGSDLKRELEEKGIVVRAQSNIGLSEEAPLAYKNIDDVIDVVEKARLSKKIARLVPIAVIKG
ncbi:MAG: RtcB family protein [Patescibacteria group bacterium]|nr:RtcB family protein [Patescibacteria group bacterium]